MKELNGVWCYDKNTNEIVKPENWTNNNVSGGVVVVTEEHAFRVLPHYNVSLQWGNHQANRLCKNKKAIGGKKLTDKIIAAHKGVEHKSTFDDKYNFIGSPAAEFCKSVGGYLPSVVELRIIAEHINDINRCMRVMGQPTLPIDYYWSSIEHNKATTYSVFLANGFTTYSQKSAACFVRAITTF